MNRLEKTHDPMRSSLVTLIHRLTDNGKTPSRIIAHDEAIDSLRQAISRLPREQRQAIELYYLKNFGVEETARNLGRTTDAVRGLLHRAKKALQRSVNESVQCFSKN